MAPRTHSSRGSAAAPWGSLKQRRRRDGSLIPGWSLCYYRADGRRTTRKLAAATLEEAEAERARIRLEVLGRRAIAADLPPAPPPTPRERWTLREFLDRYYLAVYSANVAHSTARGKLAQLEHAAEYFDGRPMRSIERHELQLYLARVQERGPSGRPLAARTVHRWHSSLQVAWKHALAAGVVREVATLHVQLPRVRTSAVPYLAPEDVDRLLAVLPRVSLRGRSIRAAAAILADCGLRIGEATALGPDDVDFERRRLIVRTSKSGRSREVPLTTRAERMIRGVLTRRERMPAGKRRPTLFGWGSPSGLRAALLRGWKELVEGPDCPRTVRLSGRRVTPHLLRHAYAVRLTRAGVSMPDVARMLGHRDPALTVRVYAHHAPGDAMDRARDRLEAAEAERARDRRAARTAPTPNGRPPRGGTGAPRPARASRRARRRRRRRGPGAR